MIKNIKDITDLETESEQGKLLLMGIAKIANLQKDKTPNAILQQIITMANFVFKSE